MLLALTVWLTVTAPSPDGRALSHFYECHRCHSGPALDTPAPDKDCVGCHAAIEAGTFEAPKDVLSHWQERIVDLIEVPTLSSMERLRRDWVRDFLIRPHDLRPGLSAMMPRMPIDPEQAEALSRWLVPDSPVEAYDAWLAWPSRGRKVMERKGCMTCHTMDGLAPPISPAPVAGLDSQALARGMMLAPDLRYTRERFREDKLVAWLLDPPRMKPRTPMPKLDLTRAEAEDVAAFLLETRLGPPTVKPIPERLPVLTRRVGFAEVRDRVFHKVCWHCHSEADLALGDGGPGNTGGFGFGPKGLNLRDYASMTAGSIGPDGKRRSIFKKLEDGPLAGTPRLLAHMLARQVEESGGEVTGLRGMPLGLPSFPPEDIQLVESWIAQGRPE